MQLTPEIQAAESDDLPAQTKDGALKETLDAAELCMQTLRLTSTRARKKSLETQCQLLLNHAQRLRQGEVSCRPVELKERTLPTQENQIRLKTPVSKRQLRTREQIILLEGSKLHGAIFPPWGSDPEPSEFILQDGESKFVDEAHLPLSKSQLKVFDGWRRPEEVLASSKVTEGHTHSVPGPTVTAHDTVDLVQDITSDCSLVASLCAGTARAERGHPRIMSSIMYPYDHVLMKPAMSHSGKYIFKLNFNGCFRKVIIDDRLPSSRTARSLHVSDRRNPDLLWPALVEKAYLKVRGGYAIPGSNSGTDVWVLTGWIPEQIFLQSDDAACRVLWTRIYNAFRRGYVLVTMGTGRLTKIEEESMGLAGEHDYAVLAMKETSHQKLLLIKNPWAEGTTWKGDAGYGELLEPLADSQIESNMSGALISTSPLSPGTFWMGLQDVYQSFESIYLNWDPGLFSHREDIHFSWHLAGRDGRADSLEGNPQFDISTSIGGILWILLSRHFTSQSISTDRNAEDDLKTIEDRGYISLYAYALGGQKVIRRDGALSRTPYVDSPNTLLKLEVPANTSYTIVVSEQALPRSTFNFTLSALSMGSLSIRDAKERYRHYELQHGAWTHITSGGNATNACYHVNPQYSVHLAERSDLSMLLETGNENLPVHVKLVWSRGESVTAVRTRDIIGDSGEYQNGYAFAEILNVEAGSYTIICSTFETGQLGKFSLRIGSMSPCTVDRLRAAEAGRLTSKIGTVSFTRGNDRVLVPLLLRRMTRLFMTAHWNSRSTRVANRIHSPLKLALEYGQGPTKKVLTVSGHDAFLNSDHGVRTPDVDVQPEMCQSRGLWISLERLGQPSQQQDNEDVEVELFSDNPVQFGKWRAEYE